MNTWSPNSYHLNRTQCWRIFLLPEDFLLQSFQVVLTLSCALWLAVKAAGCVRFCVGGRGVGGDVEWMVPTQWQKKPAGTPADFCKWFLFSSLLGPLKGRQVQAKTCIVKSHNSFHMTGCRFRVSNYPKKNLTPPAKGLLDAFPVLPHVLICGGKFKLRFVWSHIGQMLRLIFNLWAKLRPIWRTFSVALCLHGAVSKLLSSVSHLRPGKQFLAEKRGT